MDGKLLNHETIRTTNVFIAAYIFIFAASFFLISLNGFDMVTNFTAVAAGRPFGDLPHAGAVYAGYMAAVLSLFGHGTSIKIVFRNTGVSMDASVFFFVKEAAKAGGNG